VLSSNKEILENTEKGSEDKTKPQHGTVCIYGRPHFEHYLSDHCFLKSIQKNWKKHVIGRL